MIEELILAGFLTVLIVIFVVIGIYIGRSWLAPVRTVMKSAEKRRRKDEIPGDGEKGGTDSKRDVTVLAEEGEDLDGLERVPELPSRPSTVSSASAFRESADEFGESAVKTEEPSEREKRSRRKKESPLIEGPSEMADEEPEERAPLSVGDTLPTTTTYRREIWYEYWTKMNVNVVYTVTIELRGETREASVTRENLLTGERRVERTDQVGLTTKGAPIVTVEAIYPGCYVTPQVQYADLREETTITFHVLPMALGSFDTGYIVFRYENALLKAIETPFKVVNRRMVRYISLAATLVGLTPTAWEYVTGFSVNAQLNEHLRGLLSALPNLAQFDMAIILEILIIFLAGTFGLAFYFLNRDSQVEQVDQMDEKLPI